MPHRLGAAINNSVSNKITLKTPSIGVFSFICLVIGIVVSWGIFSGDQQGRVNLLLLLFVYVVIPLLGILTSVASILMSSKRNLFATFNRFPFWSALSKQQWHRFKIHSFSKWWALFASQTLLLAFSLGCLLMFVLVLLVSDVNFIWRSTLLSAQQLHQTLHIIALPWSFWEGAQPTLELLLQSQDSRLQVVSDNATVLQQWWRFVFAAQLFYAVIPRTIIAVCGWLIYRLKSKNAPLPVTAGNTANGDTANPTLAPVVNKISDSLVLVNWAGFSAEVVAQLTALPGNKVTEQLKAGPLVSLNEQQLAERWQGPQLVMVKSWEPPLAELGDYLENGQGYLCPLEIKQGKVSIAEQPGLDEWRRFCALYQHWQIYQPELVQCS